MSCSYYLDWWQQHLDGSAPAEAEEALQEHLAGCAGCRERERAAQRLHKGLCLLAPPAPPSGLADRIATRVLAERRQRAYRRRLVTIVSLAASLLLVAVGLALRPVLFPARPTATGQVPEVVKAPDRASEQAPPRRSPRLPRKTLESLRAALVLGLEAEEGRQMARQKPLRQSVQEMGMVVASVGRQTADEALGSGRLFLPIVSPSGLGGLSIPETLSPPAQSLQSATESMSTALTPVTGEARRAVDLFLREVPPMGNPD